MKIVFNNQTAQWLSLRWLPRTLVQAEVFDKIAEKIGKEVDAVIDLQVKFEILEERITGRRICPKCGAIYHIHNHPSKVEGVCDVCGSELQQRKDDNSCS